MEKYYIWNNDSKESAREWFMTKANSEAEAIRKVIEMQHATFDKEDWHDKDNYVAYHHTVLESITDEGGVVYFHP